MTASPAPASNPLLQDWATPFGIPPFEAIEPTHYRPAFDTALAEQRAAIDAIAADKAEPTFDNTIAALEGSGSALKKVSAVFYNLAGSHTNDALQGIEREMAPVLAKHRNAIFMNEALFRRVDALHRRKAELGLRPSRRGARPLPHHLRARRRAAWG
jgi:peptidyl-dipeptidase Dcp